MSNRQYWFWFAVRAAFLVALDGIMVWWNTLAPTNVGGLFMPILNTVLLVVNISWIRLEYLEWRTRHEQQA